MIAITTRSSIRVKPERTRRFMDATPRVCSAYYECCKDNTLIVRCKGVAARRASIWQTLKLCEMPYSLGTVATFGGNFRVIISSHDLEEAPAMPISSLRALATFVAARSSGGPRQRVADGDGAGDDPPRPPAGDVRLESGRVAQYTIHVDRNSLRGSVRLNDGLIALTSSGILLRFEMPAVRLIRERIGAEEVTCLGRGEGETVLAGLSDGRICRVDPGTLDLTDIAKLPDAPQWVGWAMGQGNRPAGLVAVIRLTKPEKQGGRQWLVRSTVVNDLATGKRLTMDEIASTILLDRAGRLWLGADKGEWGGRLWWVDLARADALGRSNRLPLASLIANLCGTAFMG